MPNALVKIVRRFAADADANPDDKLFNDPSPEAQAADRARLAAYVHGQWAYIGVMAAAEIRIPYGKDFIVTEIESPGLWGIESDSDEDYLNSVFEDEKKTLLDMLESLKTFEME